MLKGLFFRPTCEFSSRAMRGRLETLASHIRPTGRTLETLSKIHMPSFNKLFNVQIEMLYKILIYLQVE